MLKKFLVCLGIAVIVTGCSSGGTSTSIGLNLTGSWSGVIRSNNTGRSARMTLSLTQATDASEVTGVATFGPGSCMTGASVTGTVAGAGINFEVSSATSTLTMGGQFNAENAISGTWFNTADTSTTTGDTTTTSSSSSGSTSSSSSGTVTDPGRSTTTLNTACANEAGTWTLSRR